MKKLSKLISTKDIRKASFLCAVFCFSVFMTACANNKTVISEKTGGAEWMMTDSIFVKQIDDSLKYVLFEPDTVKCYHISYKEKIKEKEYEVVKDYIRDSLISVLSASQISVLQYVLLSDATNYLLNFRK